MSITLSPTVEALIQRKVDSGRYGAADQVVLEAMRLLEENERLEWLRAAIAEGDEGEGIPYTPELRAEMRETARRNVAAGERPNLAVLPPDDGS